MKKASLPVIDLHSDLLSFLTHKPGRTPHDPSSRSSHAQLMEGNVKLQTLAVYTTTGEGSVEKAKSQIAAYRALVREYPACFSEAMLPLNTQSANVHLMLSFENASGFAGETEPLKLALERLEGYLRSLGSIFYIGMTWDEENRFGGGNRSTKGLKDDGVRLLEWMHGKQIAVDFSHTSDWLASDIFNVIDREGLDIPVMASHSNFRAISNYPRNLPEEITKEIIRRKGVIGLNFFLPFVHDTDPSALVRHVEYALELGGAEALALGADFFCDADFPNITHKYGIDAAYYPQLSDAACYPHLMEQLAEKLSLGEEQLLNIASRNALNFLSRIKK